MAASLVLVLGTGLGTELIARSLAAPRTVDMGLDADRIAFVRTDWSRSGIEGGDAVRVALDEMRRRAQAMPGVSGAAMVSRLPAQNVGSTSTEVEGYTPPAGTEAAEMPFAVVSDGYFETLGIPRVTGRLFGGGDVPDSNASSILTNEAAAKRFYGDANPIGRRMRAQASEAWTRTVVGVVGDVPVGRLGEAPRPMFYFSTRQATRIPAYLMVRTEGDPATLATPRLATRAMGVFSLLALLLAGLGIYEVVGVVVAGLAVGLGVAVLVATRIGGLLYVVDARSGTVSCPCAPRSGTTRRGPGPTAVPL